MGEMAAFARALCDKGTCSGALPPRPGEAVAEAGRGCLLGVGLAGGAAPTAASADSDEVMKKAGAYSICVCGRRRRDEGGTVAQTRIAGPPNGAPMMAATHLGDVKGWLGRLLQRVDAVRAARNLRHSRLGRRRAAAVINPHERRLTHHAPAPALRRAVRCDGDGRAQGVAFKHGDDGHVRIVSAGAGLLLLLLRLLVCLTEPL